MMTTSITDEPGSPSTSRVKGPLVWLDMDQKQLDDAYDQSVYAPNHHSLPTDEGWRVSRAETPWPTDEWPTVQPN